MIKFYQFPLRGFHSLEHLTEPTHGHLAYLRVGLPLPLEEKRFLEFVKAHILSQFDKNDWSLAVNGPPSGELVLLKVFEILQQSDFEVEKVELQETEKNLFCISRSSQKPHSESSR